jgi:hypothetical protein
MKTSTEDNKEIYSNVVLKIDFCTILAGFEWKAFNACYFLVISHMHKRSEGMIF